MNDQMTQMKYGAFLQSLWRDSQPKSKRRWRIVLLLFLVCWLVGGWFAYYNVAGIERLSGLTRPLMAFSMGGFGLLWTLLKWGGAFQETLQAPNLFWIPLGFALPLFIYGLTQLLDREVHPSLVLRQKQKQFARSQGQRETRELIKALSFERGIPFAQLRDEQGEVKRIGLEESRDAGHVLVAGSTRTGKGLHLTETLLSWRGPVFVVDPKSEQLQRTAAFRSQFGPVFQLPGHAFPLANYYARLRDEDRLLDLHAHWMRPWQEREKIFSEKAAMLFSAAGAYANAHGLDPIRVMLDAAQGDPVEAFQAMKQVREAGRYIDAFLDGGAPDSLSSNKLAQSAYGNYSTRLKPFQKHIDTIAPLMPSRRDIPSTWSLENGTIYITYSLAELAGVGGLVASIIGAVLSAQQLTRQPQRLLMAIDELPAFQLQRLNTYLASVGGYGVTLLLYVQSVAQLYDIYSRPATDSILANCAHQVWYPPADMATAETMSRLYGLSLEARPSFSSAQGARQWQGMKGERASLANQNASTSWSWQEHPTLLPSQMMGLPQEQVLVSTRRERKYTTLAERVNPIPLFDKLPSPQGLRLPKPRYGKRVYTDWKTNAPKTDATDANQTSEEVTGGLL